MVVIWLKDLCIYPVYGHTWRWWTHRWANPCGPSELSPTRVKGHQVLADEPLPKSWLWGGPLVSVVKVGDAELFLTQYLQELIHSHFVWAVTHLPWQILLGTYKIGPDLRPWFSVGRGWWSGRLADQCSICLGANCAIQFNSIQFYSYSIYHNTNCL